MSERKAVIITAVGAGGKSTYLHDRALEYIRAGKKAAITTTTHIWRPEEKDCAGIGMYAGHRNSDAEHAYVDDVGFHVNSGGRGDAALVFHGTDGVDTIGVPMDDGRLSVPSREEYRRMCAEYDAVLVEGDGSRCMPVKLPGPGEPVIPDGADEIAVVMGRQAIGRRLDIVCHRYERGRLEKAGIIPVPGQCSQESREDTVPLTVTEQMLKGIADEFYVKPLHEEYPSAKVFYAPGPYMADEPAGVTVVLMASGFGRRYGGNKLLETFEGKALYRHALDHIAQALGRDSVVVVTQYDEIISQVEETGIRAVKNNYAAEGISASIRIGTRFALENCFTGKTSYEADPALIFFAADMPYLSADEIRRYVSQFLWSGKTFGCMEYGPEHTMTNPGAFRLLRVPSRLVEGVPDHATEADAHQAAADRQIQAAPDPHAAVSDEVARHRLTVSDMLLNLTGDRGAMRIMKKYPQEIYHYQVPAEEVLDIDVRQP